MSNSRGAVLLVLAVLFSFLGEGAAIKRAGMANFDHGKKPRMISRATMKMTAALLDAAIKGNAEEIRSVLASPGADPNAMGPDDETPLMLAAEEGHADIVSLLLAAGADPLRTTTSGETAAMLAETYGHPDVVALLEAATAAREREEL